MMGEDAGGEVLNFLRAWREAGEARLDRIAERLGKIESDVVGALGYRKQVEAELAVLRARQDQQDVFNRGIAAFMVELQSTLARIEGKLS